VRLRARSGAAIRARDRQRDSRDGTPRALLLPFCRHHALRSATAIRLGAVVADGLDWTAFHRLFTESLFLRRGRLFIDIGMATVIVAAEIRRRGFPAEITVDALVIDVELSLNVFGIFICDVRH